MALGGVRNSDNTNYRTIKTAKEWKIYTHRKKFYSGMTLEEANQNGVTKRFLGRDFFDIDKNNDGVLSFEEVLEERIIDYRRKAVFSALCAIGCSLWTILDFDKKAFKKDKLKEGLFLAFDISLDLILGFNVINNFLELKKAKEKLNNYRKKGIEGILEPAQYYA